MSTSSQGSKVNVNQWRTVSYMHNGKPHHVDLDLPANADSDYEEEAIHFVQTLEDNQQIQHEPGPLEPGKTHQIVTDESGNQRLVRRGFSAI